MMITANSVCAQLSDRPANTYIRLALSPDYIHHLGTTVSTRNQAMFFWFI